MSNVEEQRLRRKAQPKQDEENDRYSGSDRRLDRETDYDRDRGRAVDFDRPRDGDRRRGDSREGRRDGPRFDNTATTTRLHEHIRTSSGSRGEVQLDDERSNGLRLNSGELRRRGEDDSEGMRKPSLRRQETEDEEEDDGDRRRRGRAGASGRNRREAENEVDAGDAFEGQGLGNGLDGRGRSKLGAEAPDRAVSKPPFNVRANRALDEDDDDDEGQIDFKAEKQRYARSSQGEDSGTVLPGSRPPRHPAQPAVSAAKSGKGVSVPGQARALDSGVKADEDYLNEDWDDGNVPSPEAKGARSKPIHSGVRADQGWLDEDFDD